MSFEDIVQAPEVEAPARSSRRPRGGGIPVGAMPRVSLLPPEIRDAARIRTMRLGLVGAVAATVAVTAGAVVLATAVAGAAGDRLAATTARTQTLVAQVAKFSDVSKLSQEITLAKAAVAVGRSTQLDWRTQYDDLIADMPYGYTVTGVTGDSASVTAAYDQGDSPLEKPRVATITLTVTAPNTVQMPPWLRRIRSIPAYADASASWDHDGSSGGGGVTITVIAHLNKKALVHQGGTK